jgi:hypothetical protein
MSMVGSVECLAGEREALGGNLYQCLSVHHKSHTNFPGLELLPTQCESGAQPPELRYSPFGYDYTLINAYVSEVMYYVLVY